MPPRTAVPGANMAFGLVKMTGRSPFGCQQEQLALHAVERDDGFDEVADRNEIEGTTDPELCGKFLCAHGKSPF
jgi:hypothetical protein